MRICYRELAWCPIRSMHGVAEAEVSTDERGYDWYAGLLYGILGFMMLTKPGLAASVFTLLLASMLLVGGLFRVIFATSTHFHGWFWTLISGGINLLLGLMIWQEWPEASLWVIGLFVGIDLIFTGWTWVALSLGLASLPDEPKTV